MAPARVPVSFLPVLSTRPMAQALREHDWPRFAALYNGPNYAAQGYEHRLARAYAAHGGVTPPSPD